MALVLVTASAEPVSVAELQAHLRLEGPEADLQASVLAAFLEAARQYVETFTRRTLLETVYDLVLDAFPRPRSSWGGDAARGAGEELPPADRDRTLYYDDVLELPAPPLKQVDSVKYLDPDEVLQTLPTADYVVDVQSTPGRIWPASSTTGWPETAARPSAVTVRFRGGYASAALVPAPLKMGIKLLAASWFEHREGTAPDGMPAEVPLGVRMLLRSQRWGSYV